MDARLACERQVRLREGAFFIEQRVEAIEIFAYE